MRRLTAAALTTVVVLGVAGCGSTAAEGPAARSPEQVRLDLQQTYELTWGDPRTRHAAEVLAYVAHQERLAACLADRGTGHVPAPFLDATARDPGPLSWYDPLPPVTGVGELLVPVSEPAAEPVPTRTWPGPAPTSDDLSACVDGPPAVAALDPGLDAELYRVVTDALGDAAEIDDYSDCLQDNGFAASSRDDLVGTMLAERLPGGGAGPRERAAVVADAGCRTEAHREAMAALDGPLRAFREQHADELGDLPRRADLLRRDAERAAERIGLPVTWW